MEFIKQCNNAFHMAAEKLLSDSSTQIYAEEGTNIRRSVERLVGKFVDRVGQIDNRFKVEEILSVGGFYEGTKVGKADEFDFLVVIEELSQPGVLRAKIDEPMKATFTFRNASLQSRWSDFVQDGQLSHFSCNFTKNHEGQTYGSIMVDMVKRLLKDEDIEFYDNSIITIGDNDIDDVVDFVDDEDLSLVGISVSIPNIILNMEWKGMALSADISPAFRYHDLDDLITKDQFVHKDVYDKIVRNGSLLLVTTQSDDKIHFKITFTEIEFAMVKELTPMHVKVYRFLKYVHYICKKKVPYIDYRSKLTSYLYKTACVYVHLKESGRITNAVEYMYNVLKHLYTCIHNKHVPSLFCKSQNLFRYELFGNVEDLVLTSKQELVLIAQVMQRLSTSEVKDLGDLNEKTVYVLVATFWRGGGFKGYENHFICSHIKQMMSQKDNANYKITPRYKRKMVFRPKKQILKSKRHKASLRKRLKKTIKSPYLHNDIILEGKVIKSQNVETLSKWVNKKHLL